MSNAATLVVLLASLGAQPRGEVLDFSATWCGPCQQMNPIVSRLKREGLPIRKVDVDQERALAERYNITSIPAFVLVVDGEEVARSVGATTEANLRRMLAKIPSQPARTRTLPEPEPLVADTPAEDQQLPRDRTKPPLRTEPEEIAAAPEKESLWERMIPGAKRDEPYEALGQEPEATDPGQPPAHLPLAASSRIRVAINGNLNLGSGTVISSRPGQTLIVTCGHIFRDMTEESKIEVDLFTGESHRTFIGKVVNYDLEADVGLIVVPTDTAVPSTAIAGDSVTLATGDQVACIGCSGGNPPTREQMRLTAVNKYNGPDNIECTGTPVQGRSGGGLFNLDGELIGVCIAADKESNRGLYAHAFAVHDLLDDSNLAYLYQPRQEPAAPESAIADNLETPTDPGTSAAPPACDAEPPVETTPAKPPAGPATGLTDVAAGDAEVVVIIRPRGQPNAASRVVIINQASRKFLSYLDGELQPAADNMTAHRMLPTTRTVENPQARSRHESRRARSDARPFPTSQPSRRPRARKAGLEPTAFSKPDAPERYVRSARTR
mgnify:CR=1 FL=1